MADQQNGNHTTGKAMVNPPLQIIGVGRNPVTKKPAAVGFTFAGPRNENLAILFTEDQAELFIADLISALRKMQGQEKKADS